MANKISLYVTTDDKRKVYKTLSTVVKDVNCQFFDNCSVLAPSVLLDFNENYLRCNYVYVNNFKRYYYVDNITVLKGNHIQLNCTVDVLRSNADAISKLNCTIVRTAQNGKQQLYLDDGKFKVLNFPRIQTKKFPNSLSKSQSYVMTIAGGG